jgi:hypothetical protein
MTFIFLIDITFLDRSLQIDGSPSGHISAPTTSTFVNSTDKYTTTPGSKKKRYFFIIVMK